MRVSLAQAMHSVTLQQGIACELGLCCPEVTLAGTYYAVGIVLCYGRNEQLLYKADPVTMLKCDYIHVDLLPVLAIITSTALSHCDTHCACSVEVLLRLRLYHLRSCLTGDVSWQVPI